MEFTEVVEGLETKLRKIAGNVTDNRADQDDLLQEEWLYLWKNREKLFPWRSLTNLIKRRRQ